MNLLKKLWVILLLSTFFLTECAPSRKYLLNQSKDLSSSSFVKVLIYKGSGSVKVSSKKGIKLSYLKSNKFIFKGDNKNITFSVKKVSSPLVVESWGANLAVNGREYRGTIEIHRQLNKLLVINVLRMSQYLAAVVPSEMMSSWPEEALKAQAVAARTYAYYHILQRTKNIYNLDSTTNFQVYKGVAKEAKSSTRAVVDTANEIMSYDNKPILAFFHSTCGGQTIDNDYVWSREAIPYLRGRRCPYCTDSPHYNWQYKILLSDLKIKLSRRYRNIGNIKGISFKKYQGRVFEVLIIHRNGRLKISGNELRMIISPKKIKSLFFKSKKIKNGLLIAGHGWGHGVGLCQYGAKGMALKGIKYKSILKFYYKGIKINKFRF